MSTNFASSTYASAFMALPKPDVQGFRKSTFIYLENFDVNKWYDEPVSIMNSSNSSLLHPHDDLRLNRTCERVNDVRLQ